MRTDKEVSGLFRIYEELFAKFKDEPIRYLEVGVAYGDSMMWAEKYFSKALLFGIDIVAPKIYPKDAAYYNINQNNSEELTMFGNEHGPFDIIIDDASHMARETKNTFDNLYPFLKRGGFYIIEDWGAPYLPQFLQCAGLERLVTDLVWEHGGSVVRLPEGGSLTVMIGCFATINK